MGVSVSLIFTIQALIVGSDSHGIIQDHREYARHTSFPVPKKHESSLALLDIEYI